MKPENQTVTIQKTSKALKAQGVLSVVVIAIGALWLFLAPSWAAVTVFLAGCTWKLIVKARIWWHHE